ncbi:MAG: hypothetical protein ACKVT1_06140 [Dehalococcoidia bacterium]
MVPPGRQRPFPAWIIVLLAAVVASSLAGCGGGRGDNGPGPAVQRSEPAGEPRAVRLGFGVLPAELTTEAYRQAFATAAQYADVVRIQRPPPWEDFLPGGHISTQTEDTTRLETSLLAQYRDLKRFYAIDPTDAAVRRTRPANLPASIDPNEGFNSPALREAFLKYTAYIAKSYQPDYLALGVEINMLADRRPDQFEAFVTLYHEAYRVAKDASPKTKVFPTFQLEDLEGRLDAVHPPHWDVLENFRGVIDVLAVSTYPYLADLGAAGGLPPDYYTQLKTRFTGEIMVAETAYPSAQVEGRGVIGSEEDQRGYLTSLLRDAEASGIGTVIWVAPLDPAFATTGNATVFRDVGLRKSDGSNKLAWSVWEEWARRPLK